MITREQIHDIIRQIVPGIGVSKIDANTRLREYGIDSMDYFSIILELQELLGKEIPDEDIDQLTTVASIQEYLKKNTA